MYICYMRSAVKNPTVVEEYLAMECKLGKVIGLLDPAVFPHVQINRFGVIPKPHQPGKWMLIVDLTYPEEGSINDGIIPELCSLQYPSVDDVVKAVLSLGRSTKLVKFDIQGAYRIIPVHPSDRQLLGMAWNGKLCVDTALPFGLRSAPKSFTAVADALRFILLRKRHIKSYTTYVDDFLLFGAPSTSQCGKALQLVLEWCTRLDVPIAEGKTEDLVEHITFLGIQIDTLKGELCLPEEKLHFLQREIGQWIGKRSCKKKDFLSLSGPAARVLCAAEHICTRLV